MSKRNTINELTNVLAVALRHKIGSIVNELEIYAAKYAKDAELFMKEAQKISLREHWNLEDRKIIKKELERKLYNELAKKEFLNEGKFKVMNSEIEKALEELELSD